MEEGNKLCNPLSVEVRSPPQMYATSRMTEKHKTDREIYLIPFFCLFWVGFFCSIHIQKKLKESYEHQAPLDIPVPHYPTIPICWVTIPCFPSSSVRFFLVRDIYTCVSESNITRSCFSATYFVFQICKHID